MAHPDGAGEPLQAATPRIPTPRTPADDAPSRPRHAAPDPLTGEYPGLLSRRPLAEDPTAPLPRPPSAPTPTRVPHSSAPTRSAGPAPASTAAPASGQPAGTTPPPTVPRKNWAGHDETMVLPAFLTGKAKEPPPEPSGPKRPDPAAKLDGTERGMLIFVAALLGLGTIAVVAFMGMGLGTSKPKAAAPTAKASVAAPAPSPVASASPTEAPSPTDSPTATPSHTTVAPRLLGPISGADEVAAYCRATAGGNTAARGPGSGGASSWVCYNIRNRNTTPVSPTSVCRWRYGDTTAYTSSKASDALPWKCYT